MPHPHDLAREVILSYRLLFGQHSSSRSTFEKIRSKDPGFARRSDADPCLQKLCSSDCSAPLYAKIRASTPAKQYSARKEFPLLGQRLVILQKYILDQSPSDWDGLRHDRRDIRKEYAEYRSPMVANLKQFGTTHSGPLSTLAELPLYSVLYK